MKVGKCKAFLSTPLPTLRESLDSYFHKGTTRLLVVFKNGFPANYEATDLNRIRKCLALRETISSLSSPPR